MPFKGNNSGETLEYGVFMPRLGQMPFDKTDAGTIISAYPGPWTSARS